MGVEAHMVPAGVGAHTVPASVGAHHPILLPLSMRFPEELLRLQGTGDEPDVTYAPVSEFVSYSHPPPAGVGAHTVPAGVGAHHQILLPQSWINKDLNISHFDILNDLTKFELFYREFIFSPHSLNELLKTTRYTLGYPESEKTFSWSTQDFLILSFVFKSNIFFVDEFKQHIIIKRWIKHPSVTGFASNILFWGPNELLVKNPRSVFITQQNIPKNLFDVIKRSHPIEYDVVPNSASAVAFIPRIGSVANEYERFPSLTPVAFPSLTPVAEEGGRVEPPAEEGGRVEPLTEEGERVEPPTDEGERVEPLADEGERVEPLAETQDFSSLTPFADEGESAEPLAKDVDLPQSWIEMGLMISSFDLPLTLMTKYNLLYKETKFTPDTLNETIIRNRQKSGLAESNEPFSWSDQDFYILSYVLRCNIVFVNEDTNHDIVITRWIRHPTVKTHTNNILFWGSHELLVINPSSRISSKLYIIERKIRPQNLIDAIDHLHIDII